MTKNVKITLVLLISLVLFGTLSAQFSPETDIVNIKIYKSFDKIHPGSQVKIAIKANIKNGWHINSVKPKEDFLIPTTIVLDSSSGLNFGKLKFPDSEDLKFDFSDTPLAVYQGNILIGAIITIPKNYELGKKKIKLSFGYQACNNVNCLPPYSVDTTFTLEIVDNKTQISEINSDIFSTQLFGSNHRCPCTYKGI